MNIKKGDNVMVISGKDKGKQGKVVTSLPTKDRLVVEGVNVAHKRIRPRKQGQKGQTIDVAMPLHISNVGLYCSKCKKAVRTGVEIVKGEKVRVCKKCGKEI